MSKRCIPGVICLENMTLAILFFLFVVLGYLYYVFLVKVVNRPQNTPLIITPTIIGDMNPNIPTDGYFTNGIPVNIETRGLSQSYSQIGILTRSNNNELILPLMGRRLMSGIDKWQYYTISNTGSINTRLPISLRGKKCSGEYGCECLMDGDVVYVDGYQDTFRTTLYETAKFQYIPYI